jgi:predicted dehydrogenase
MGYWHAQALRRAGAALALVVDRDLDRATRLAGRHSRCAVAASLDAAALPEIDVVHVCTPSGSHEALVRQALEQGCHVLAEKPLAETEAATRTLLDLAASRGRLLCPVFQVLFQRCVGEALAMAASRRALHLDLVMCSAGASGDAAAHDRLVGEILPHPLSLVDRLTSGAHAAGAWQLLHPAPGEVRAVGAWADTTVSMLISTHGRPTANAARLVTDRDTIHLDLFHDFAVVQPGAVSRRRKIVQPLLFSALLGGAAGANLLRRTLRLEPAYPGLRRLVASFYEQVRRGGASPIPPDAALRIAAVRDDLLARLRASA